MPAGNADHMQIQKCRATKDTLTTAYLNVFHCACLAAHRAITPRGYTLSRMSIAKDGSLGFILCFGKLKPPVELEVYISLRRAYYRRSSQEARNTTCHLHRMHCNCNSSIPTAFYLCKWLLSFSLSWKRNLFILTGIAGRFLTRVFVK